LGTEISLDVGGMSICWAKNGRGSDHGFLFQQCDRQRFPSDKIDYDTDVESEEDASRRAEMEIGFTRLLRTMVPRLELLGYTLSTAEAEYDDAAAASIENRKLYIELDFDGDAHLSDVMSFEDFRSFIAGIAIGDLNDDFDYGNDDERENRIMGRFTDETFKSRLPSYEDIRQRLYWSERSYFRSLIAFLHPYTLLRLLAENPANLDARVQWQYGPLISSDWAEDSEFTPKARRTQTYLIATEGSSDVHILKRAFEILRPEIVDFFRFIDVSKGHPFSGAGSLVKFAEGLTKIDVHNRTVFVLDNDAEGVSAFCKISDQPLPMNMRAMTLPSHESLRAIRTIGPDGEANADINGRAAAIECYLDLQAKGMPPPVVRWTNFKDEVGVYQGALQQKELYSKAFLKQMKRRMTYNTEKLSAVLDAIVSVCTSMATDMEVRGTDD
jgi:hypothetical protein